MPKVSTYNITGAQTGEIELNDGVFGVEVNEAVWARMLQRREVSCAAAAENLGNKKEPAGRV